MEFIEVVDLHKVYGKGEGEVEALKAINLTFKKGEQVAIIGASGSGKSTLLHMIGGVDTPTLGEVYIDGKSINELNDDELSYLRLRKIGFVFQFFNLLSSLTVEENIEMPVLLDNREMNSDFKEDLLKFLGLTEKRNMYPNELSGGQQQRVSIGRAIANRPSIILADEPTGNLDSKMAQEIMRILLHLAKKYNQTLIIITHDENIARLLDRVITIRDGMVVKDEVIT